MKPRFLFFSLVCSLFSFTVFAQDFEGVVTLKSMNNEGLAATFTIDGNNVLMETQAEEGKVKMLSNKENGDFYILTEDTDKGKMAIKNNMNNPMMQSAMGRIESQSTTEKENYTIKVTNETKMINGYKCVKIIGSDDDAEGYAWVAKDLKLNLADLMPIAKMNGGKSINKKMEEVYGTSGFVMELFSKDKKTGEEYSMQAAVEEKPVSINPSEIMEGYNILDMTDMMKLMQEAQKDPKKMEQLQEMMKRFENN